MARKVYITGIGIVSGIGNNVSQTLDSIYKSKSGIGKISILRTNLAEELPAAEIKHSDEELMDILQLPKIAGYTRTALLGMIAAKEATGMINFKISPELKSGIVSATTVGGMGKTELYINDFQNDPEKLIYLQTHDCGDSTEKIADMLGVKDYVSTISTACSSSANSIMTGARLIRNNFLDRAVVGGTDSLAKFTLNGFNTLMILDRNGCKPFDEFRNGLTLGEGAAYLVLESEDCIKTTQNTPLAEIIGWANANDAFHQTASSPDGDGALLAMQKALDVSCLNKHDIDYINAHGTGTQNNDLSEGRAIERLFGNNIPPLSSTKSFTGHTLGAAGAVEAVLSVLAIKNNLIYPTLGFSEKMKELSFTPISELISNAKVNNVLSNSFGFGGNNTSLIFSRSKI